MIDSELTHFGIFLIAGLASPIIIKLVQYFLAPNIPRLKAATSTYECGEKPIGDAHIRFNTQFYTFAVVFVVFDILSILFLLWAFAFQIIDATVTAVLVMGFLALFVFIGLAFWMKKGTMSWV